MSAEKTPAATGAWPQGCIKRSSCARNKACMYGWNGSCQHLQRDIRAEVDAASVARSNRPAEPAPEVEVGDGEVVAWGAEMEGFWALCNDEQTARLRYEPKHKVEPLVRRSTLEAERAKTAAAKAERDEARADRGIITARADHWKAKADRLERKLDVAVKRVAYLTTARQEIATAYTLCRADLAAAEASLSKVQQERDEIDPLSLERFTLWFFRDLTKENRLSLFRLFGWPTAEIDSMGMAKRVLKAIMLPADRARHRSSDHTTPTGAP